MGDDIHEERPEGHEPEEQQGAESESTGGGESENTNSAESEGMSSGEAGGPKSAESEGASGGETGDPLQTQHGDKPEEEEKTRARLEEELKKITVRDILLQTCVSLANLGFQRLGLTERTEDMRDLHQAKTAIEALRVLLPLLEMDDSKQIAPLRDALSQMQLAYARVVETTSSEAGKKKDEAAKAEGRVRKTEGEARKAGDRSEEPAERGERPGQRAGQPKSSGRLWVPPGTQT